MESCGIDPQVSQDGGGKQNHDAFPAPAYPDLIFLDRWMSGGNSKVHENRRHQKIHHGGNEQKEEVVKLDQPLLPYHQRGDVPEG
jgi:hypothetical protein